MPGAKSDRNPTDWGNSQRVGVDMTDEEWADLGTLIAMKTPAGERPSYGRFIANRPQGNFAPNWRSLHSSAGNWRQRSRGLKCLSSRCQINECPMM
jgi:hypothetical protein